MINVRFTERERDAVIFALRSDLEVVSNDPIEFGEDEAPLRSALRRVENSRAQRGTGHDVEPCPVCEMGVYIGGVNGNDKDKVMITTDGQGRFAGAVAVHGGCLDQYTKQVAGR